MSSTLRESTHAAAVESREASVARPASQPNMALYAGLLGSALLVASVIRFNVISTLYLVIFLFLAFPKTPLLGNLGDGDDAYL